MELNKIPNRTEDEKKIRAFPRFYQLTWFPAFAPYQNGSEHPFSPPKGKQRNAPDNSVKFHGEKKA
jgi:hypothetical protein